MPVICVIRKIVLEIWGFFGNPRVFHLHGVDPLLLLLVYVFAGCCFVICPSRQEADKAVNACHNKKTLPGVSGTTISDFVFGLLYSFLVLC